jgi:hypothetical protein
MISSGSETAIFRLVAECLNQLRYCVPLNYYNNPYYNQVTVRYFARRNLSGVSYKNNY